MCSLLQLSYYLLLLLVHFLSCFQHDFFAIVFTLHIWFCCALLEPRVYRKHSLYLHEVEVRLRVHIVIVLVLALFNSVLDDAFSLYVHHIQSCSYEDRGKILHVYVIVVVLILFDFMLDDVFSLYIHLIQYCSYA